MAIVSPSCTVTCVLTAFWENEGDWIAELEDGCCGSLTCWLMTMVTMPLGLTRARMLSVVPVLTLEIVLVNSELPADLDAHADTLRAESRDRASDVDRRFDTVGGNDAGSGDHLRP